MTKKQWEDPKKKNGRAKGGRRGPRAGVGRRDFLVTGASGALAAGLGIGGGLLGGCGGGGTTTTPMEDAGRRETELRILLWNHFVPQNDRWFDPFAQAWGEANGVTVTVTHVSFDMVRPMFDAELAAGSGHDIVEFVTPPPDLEPHVVDLADVVAELQSRHGEMLPLCRRNCYNPHTDTFYGINHGWAPDPANYRRSLWEAIGMPGGPTTWQELLDGGRSIFMSTGVPVGIGLNSEPDANMAARALLWSYGATVSDASGVVSIDSAETQAAIDYMTQLYTDAMTEEVLTWGAASNNVALVEGRTSYILNSISAYRTAQTNVPLVADDIYFQRALLGPTGMGIAGSHASPTMVIPRHSRNQNAARDFILHYVGNYNQATFNSALYNLPAFPMTTPQLEGETGWLAADPFGSRPLDKLAVLQDAAAWSTNIGHPGNANPAIGEVFSAGILPMMFSAAATGSMTAAQAAAWANDQIQPIFERWRMEGLIP